MANDLSAEHECPPRFGEYAPFGGLSESCSKYTERDAFVQAASSRPCAMRRVRRIRGRERRARRGLPLLPILRDMIGRFGTSAAATIPCGWRCLAPSGRRRVQGRPIDDRAFARDNAAGIPLVRDRRGGVRVVVRDVAAFGLFPRQTWSPPLAVLVFGGVSLWKAFPVGRPAGVLAACP